MLPQGLCASGERAEDEGDGAIGVLAVSAQASGDLTHACPMQETERRIAQQRHHRWSLPGMDQAGILPERDILAPMQAVFDRPVPTLERQQPVRRTSLRSRLVIP